jgi:plasmid maintenance system antidote protein VapI
MAIHNPPHLGEFIAAVYLEPNDISGRELATRLRMSPSSLNRVLTAESWLAMQHSYVLWQARRSVDLGGIETLKVSAV